jgi:adenylate kinase family enzyme
VWYYYQMDKQFFILLGRSGSGKGTQAALLKTLLEQKHGRQVTHITTGGGFRDFIAQDKYASHLAKAINDTGGLQPEFLAVWNWSNIFINTLQGEESVILDGAPRKPFEATILHSAIEFFKYRNPVVIYLDVSESGSREHLAKRGREDDVAVEGRGLLVSAAGNRALASASDRRHLVQTDGQPGRRFVGTRAISRYESEDDVAAAGRDHAIGTRTKATLHVAVWHRVLIEHAVSGLVPAERLRDTGVISGTANRAVHVFVGDCPGVISDLEPLVGLTVRRKCRSGAKPSRHQSQ